MIFAFIGRTSADILTAKQVDTSDFKFVGMALKWELISVKLENWFAIQETQGNRVT